MLEGLALTADPNYKLLAKAYPYMAKRLLTDPAPELRWVPNPCLLWWAAAEFPGLVLYTEAPAPCCTGKPLATADLLQVGSAAHVC